MRNKKTNDRRLGDFWALGSGASQCLTPLPRHRTQGGGGRGSALGSGAALPAVGAGSGRGTLLFSDISRT